MKNRNIALSLGLVFFLSVNIAGCKKQDETSSELAQEQLTEEQYNEEQHNEKQNNVIETKQQTERAPVLYRLNPLVYDQSDLLLFSTDAHREHLDDPLEFVDPPDGGIPSGPTAVVGSEVCRFYPIESISSAEELKTLPEGALIPLATIIPLGDKLENINGEDYMEGLFNFQWNTNFFYKTTWNGEQGIVFGADLYGIDNSNEENRKNALLYKDKGYFHNFHNFYFYGTLSPRIIHELETNGLAFEGVGKYEYPLDADNPDDMISLYSKLNSFKVPIFVTTDLAAHANHLVFNRVLQYIEEEYFYPQLVTLTDAYINAIEQKKGQIPAEVYDISLLYFQAANALLALAPKKEISGDNYRKTTSYHEVDAEEVLRGYPERVVQEIENINRAGGFGISAIFGTEEDFSQYKARGHYTKNEILGAYFRSMIWFGRINFNLGGREDGMDDAAGLASAALFIADLTENSPELMKLWQSLFDPITELIGASDDISFYELIPLWNKIKGAGFLQWYNDPGKRRAFIASEYKELRSPAVSGVSLFRGIHAGGAEPENRLPPPGWRLFGQRYTLDSEIHHNVSPPRFMGGRDMVRGLDILKVFGSGTADLLLRENDYSHYPGLEGILNAMQQGLEELKDGFWFSTYYTNILYQIKTLGRFESGAGFYFTEKPGWNLKAMNSAHGTWAELRHDTILYAKQNYGEKGGGDPWKPTFRTKPLPDPVHYIEPNIPFWIASAVGIEKLYAVLEKYNYLDGGTDQTLGGMHNLFVKALEISRLEAENKEVSKKDLDWISGVARWFASLVMPYAQGNWIEDKDSLRMALVADVYTNAESETVLETAVGIPHRLYIPLNDKQGGKRIAIGYGFSYYEFEQPMADRLNNEQWKDIVYNYKSDISKYLPFWMQGRLR